MTRGSQDVLFPVEPRLIDTFEAAATYIESDRHVMRQQICLRLRQCGSQYLADTWARPPLETGQPFRTRVCAVCLLMHEGRIDSKGPEFARHARQRGRRATVGVSRPRAPTHHLAAPESNGAPTDGLGVNTLQGCEATGLQPMTSSQTRAGVWRAQMQLLTAWSPVRAEASIRHNSREVREAQRERYSVWC